MIFYIYEKNQVYSCNLFGWFVYGLQEKSNELFEIIHFEGIRFKLKSLTGFGIFSYYIKKFQVQQWMIFIFCNISLKVCKASKFLETFLVDLSMINEVKWVLENYPSLPEIFVNNDILWLDLNIFFELKPYV